MSGDALRGSFERWARPQCLRLERIGQGFLVGLGQYCEEVTQAAWESWRDCAALTAAATVDLDYELIARMLEAGPGTYTSEAVVEQVRLLRAADNRDAAGVHTARRAAPVGVGGEARARTKADQHWDDWASVLRRLIGDRTERLHFAADVQATGDGAQLDNCRFIHADPCGYIHFGHYVESCEATENQRRRWQPVWTSKPPAALAAPDEKDCPHSAFDNCDCFAAPDAEGRDKALLDWLAENALYLVIKAKAAGTFDPLPIKPTRNAIDAMIAARPQPEDRKEGKQRAAPAAPGGGEA